MVKYSTFFVYDDLKLYLEIPMENDENVLNNNQLDERIIHDCLSDVAGQVSDLVSEIDEIMTDPNPNQNENSKTREYYITYIVSLNIVSTEISTKLTTLNNDSLNNDMISKDMEKLCHRILSADSIILSNSKLNKVCKMNMPDVRKGCNLLIEYGLLSIEPKMLANRFCYYESYMKKIPQNKSELVDFSLKLAKFGITDINKYYESLKTSKFVIL
jgi:hypothetical protein